MEASFYTRFVFFSGVALMLFSGVAAEHGGFEDQADPSIGSEDAEITMEIWCDFEGPFCKEFNEEVMPEVEDEYVESGDVKVVWRDNPLEQLHPWSKEAALATECSYREGGNEAFWQVLDEVYQNQDSLDQDNVQDEIIQYTIDYNASEEDMESCISDSSVEDEVESDKEMAQDHNISGTPTTLINGEEIVGAKPYSQFESVIESKLESGSESGETEEDKDVVGEEYGSDPVLGEDNANLTMEVWCTFEGRFCKEFFQNSFPQIQDKYIDHGKVRAVYKDLPLETLYPWATDAATVMECVSRQSDSLYFDTSEVIYEDQGSIDNETVEEDIIDYAVEEGAKESQIDSCMNQEPLDEVKSDIEEAESRNISGTPTVFIGDEKVKGAQGFSEFERVIEAELNPEEENNETESSNDSDNAETDPEDLEDRLNDTSSSNITALKERVQEQEQEIEEIKEEQNTIVNILESIMDMIGL